MYASTFEAGLGFACEKEWGTNEHAALSEAIDTSLLKIAELCDKAEINDEINGSGAGDWLGVSAEIYNMENGLILQVREQFKAHAPSLEWEQKANLILQHAGELVAEIKQVLDEKKTAQIARKSKEWEDECAATKREAQEHQLRACALKEEKDAIFRSLPVPRRFTATVQRMGSRIVCIEQMGKFTHQWVLAEPKERNNAASNVGNFRLFEVRKGVTHPVIIGDSIDATIFNQTKHS